MTIVRTPHRHGFSIVELLAVMGITAILLSLLLPTLRGTRELAKAAKCLAQHRGFIVSVAAYGNDQRDSWPYPLEPGLRDPYTQARLYTDRPHQLRGYEWAASYWHLPLIRLEGADPDTCVLYDCPSLPAAATQQRDFGGGRVWSTIRQLSLAMYLSPTALDPAAPSWDESAFAVQRQSDVWYPSNKAAVFDLLPVHDPAARWQTNVLMTMPPWSRTVVACDGAARARHGADCTPGVVFEKPARSPRSRLSEEDSLRFTPRGVRGTDW